MLLLGSQIASMNGSKAELLLNGLASVSLMVVSTKLFVVGTVFPVKNPDNLN